MDKVDFEYKINNKYYNEYYARYLLESLYSDAFKNAIVYDRPDIWVESENGGIGVEVTTLLDTYYNTLKKYKKAWSKQELSIEQISKSIPALLKNKIGINKHGNLILLGNQNRHSLSKSLSGLEATIRIKLNKVQDYKNFESNNLFIFATNLSPNCSPEKIFEMLKNFDKSKFKKLFDTIMIFNYDEVQVYPFSMIGKPIFFPITNETKFYCDQLANIEQERILSEYNKKQELKKERKIIKFKKASELGDDR